MSTLLTTPILYTQLFLPISKRQPQWTRNKNRRITTADKTNSQREGKIFCRIAAEKVQCKRRKQAGKHRVK